MPRACAARVTSACIDSRSMLRRAQCVSGLLVIVVALAAGCGGDDADSSANTPEVTGQSYADTVCFIAISWEAASDKIDDYLAKTASGQDVVDDVSQAQAPTSTYVVNIRGLQEPDDPTQQKAYASLQATANQISSLASSIQTDVDMLETSAKKAQAQIQGLFGSLRTSVSQLAGIYPKSGVAAAVDAESNCAPLQS
jgi:hypothetical protein